MIIYIHSYIHDDILKAARDKLEGDGHKREIAHKNELTEVCLYICMYTNMMIMKSRPPMESVSLAHLSPHVPPLYPAPRSCRQSRE